MYNVTKLEKKKLSIPLRANKNTYKLLMAFLCLMIFFKTQIIDLRTNFRETFHKKHCFKKLV